MADASCSSKLNSKKFTFEWVISNFKSAITFSEPVQSPSYSFSLDRGFVKAWTNEEGLRCTGCGPASFSCNLTVSYRPASLVEITLSLTPDEEVEWQVGSLNVGFKVYLVDKEGDVMFSKEIMEELEIDTSVSVSFNGKKGYGSLLADGDLNLSCELTVYGKLVHTPVRSKPTCMYNHLLRSSSSLGPRMEELWRGESLTDFTLEVCSPWSQEFLVHKFVLAAHSPVFERMIQEDMGEDRYVLNDVTPNVVEELLGYMYAGEVPNLEELTEELFQVADKYEITHLKALCEEALCSSLTVDNAIDRFLLADTHNSSQMRAHCKHFIEDHISEVKKWHKLTERQQLYIELLETQLPPSKKRKRAKPYSLSPDLNF